MTRLPHLCLRSWILFLGLSAVLAGPVVGNTAITPAPREDEYAVKRRVQILERGREGHINVVFIGDSITDFWRFENPARGGRILWDREIAPLGAANFGISADRTQHVLWRLEHGDLDKLSPQAVVVMIGTNNTGFEQDRVTPRNTPDETAAGITAVVHKLREKLPEARILLLAVFPRGAQPDEPQRAQIAEINARIRALADDQHVFWLDFNDRLLEPDGTLSAEVMPDYLHPGAKGYQIWWEAMREPLRRLLQ